MLLLISRQARTLLPKADQRPLALCFRRGDSDNGLHRQIGHLIEEEGFFRTLKMEQIYLSE